MFLGPTRGLAAFASAEGTNIVNPQGLESLRCQAFKRRLLTEVETSEATICEWTLSTGVSVGCAARGNEAENSTMVPAKQQGR